MAVYHTKPGLLSSLEFYYLLSGKIGEKNVDKKNRSTEKCVNDQKFANLVSEHLAVSIIKILMIYVHYFFDIV